MSARLFFLLAAASLPLAACDEDLLGGLVPADEVGEVRVALGSNPALWPADPMSVDAAFIEEDTLHVRVSHGGGCAEHAYGAVAWNGWMESHPVQVGVLLAHESHDDPCDALLTADLRFDLTALRDAYRESYGPAPATLVLRLDSTAPSGPESRVVEYSF
jgi:hypothetical protein